MSPIPLIKEASDDHKRGTTKIDDRTIGLGQPHEHTNIDLAP